MISCITDFCEEWSLKRNITKTHIVVLMNGEKLGRNEKWWLGREKTEVVHEPKYLAIAGVNRKKRKN